MDSIKNSVQPDTQSHFKIFPIKMEKNEKRTRNESILSKEVAKVALGIFLVGTPLYLLSKIALAEENFTQILENDPRRAGTLLSDCLYPAKPRADQANEFNRNFIKNGDCLSIVNENLRKIVEKTPDFATRFTLHCLSEEVQSPKEKSACHPILENMLPFLMESAPEVGTADAHWCTRHRNPHCMPAIQKYLPQMIEQNPLNASHTISRCFDEQGKQARFVSPICESIIRDGLPLVFAKDIDATVDLFSRCIAYNDPRCKSLLNDYIPEILKKSPQGAHSLAVECRKFKGDPICNEMIKLIYSHN